ncbi:NAD-dependent epimerase/dehydratase family protein [Saccharothrix sp. NRRL B-16348]|uniref:NAD-dependent epimerase/dehydratase family protein n=1 Tax=Saccharothrix sp. NRRL B-16348 TaxID=1415542 RepID=UPI0006B0444E|nr:NAD-dependent epimerase/dehydratase family protein [Saccharothrix sp. NRRL B-16348]
MDIFITGASGYIGSALTRALVARGHRVRGLARGDAAAAKVRANGARPVRGSLADLAVLSGAAAGADGVVHIAATTGADRPAVDAAAVTAMLGGMAGGAFVTTTGAPRARSSRTPVTEDDTAEVAGPLAWLAGAEARVLGAEHVRGSSCDRRSSTATAAARSPGWCGRRGRTGWRGTSARVGTAGPRCT